MRVPNSPRADTSKWTCVCIAAAFRRRPCIGWAAWFQFVAGRTSLHLPDLREPMALGGRGVSHQKAAKLAETRALKPGLMAAAWHPRRVARHQAVLDD